MCCDLDFEKINLVAVWRTSGVGQGGNTVIIQIRNTGDLVQDGSHGGVGESGQMLQQNFL